MKYTIAILKNELQDSHERWLASCTNKNLIADIIDLTAYDWYERITSKDYSVFLLQPPGLTFRFKELYDERAYIISKVMNKFIFPTYEELILHENKRFLSFFLKANSIPHPETWVFYRKEEAMNFIRNTKFPLAAKTSIGASGGGVKFLRSQEQAVHYIRRAFGRGIRRQIGPNRNTGTVKQWTMKFLQSPQFGIDRIKLYLEEYKDVQKGFIIFQEYIPHDFEWRSVRIGDSYFAHKKVKMGEKASGSKRIDFVNPPESILNFTKKICDRFHFTSMAIDIFENGRENYLVNEMQTVFGHLMPYILKVDEKIGRYIYLDNQWKFEEGGGFNSTESYDLRLEAALNLAETFHTYPHDS